MHIIHSLCWRRTTAVLTAVRLYDTVAEKAAATASHGNNTHCPDLPVDPTTSRQYFHPVSSHSITQRRKTRRTLVTSQESDTQWLQVLLAPHPHTNNQQLTCLYPTSSIQYTWPTCLWHTAP